MIKHTLKDNIVSISIENIDFSYRIPTKKMGNTTDWRIEEKGTEGILVKNVSTWTLQLFTKETTEDKYIKEFKNIVQEYAPSNTINWEETQLALNLQNEYNLMIKTNATVEKKMNEDEIISILKKKYKLD
ncbi:MAG: hypothetical protein ACJAUD_000767 [Crocinitomicaceae bacterium]|jgi:hypothetical protein